MVEEMAVGLNKGHRVTKIAVKRRPSRRKGTTSKRVRFVRELVREVSGFAPYEKRVMELLKVGRDKRALKFIKKRVGNHTRSKRKRDELGRILQQMRKAQH
ncbi:60S ribosomal protein L36 [Trichoplax sp. H2]|uniref:60S ribosomal protein L36 n=1 Tax=Trichoplax adhaerens TaxID=10228 RepID=B3RS96_TRIAD|nr:expressed hypothetical protein [Trichoplax adhaerens]EDV27017.1 expressed hypothetical protein [Trichoplax adhaerens]RDD46315.1 60S ribosomal protein L36 [Trichoplax sp. H2]|eukprot:XP_002111013.1 expressed hypothetical protein [Trichoplax adhaerens]